MTQLKKQKPKGGHPWNSKGWKAVDVDDAFLLGAEEGGFAGLEVLEGVTIDGEILEPKQKDDGKVTHQLDGTKPAVKSKPAKKKRKAAEKTNDVQPRTESAPSQDTTDVEVMRLRIAQLEAENNRLKRQRVANGADGAETPAENNKTEQKQRKSKKKKAKGLQTGPLKEGSSTCTEVQEKQLEQPEELPDMSAWTEFLLHPAIERAVALQGFVKPTPIQAACLLPAARDRLDIIGAAQTGSGKTLAFGLPIMQVLLQERQAAESGDVQGEARKDRPLRALILCPTRELALQVGSHLTTIGRLCGVRVASIVGGLAAVKQQRLLRAHPEIVVATPGRLWDLMRDGQAHVTQLDHLSFFVLDEADRMVQQGCYQELSSILDQIPRPSKHGKGAEAEEEDPEEQAAGEGAPSKGPLLQTFVFSATLTLPLSLRKRLKKGGGGAGGGTASLQTLMDRIPFRGQPRIVDLTTERRLAEAVQESQVVCLDVERDETLYYLLARHPGRTLVFVNAVSSTRRVVSLLKLLGLPAYALHAQQQQRQRLRALDRFRAQEQAVLVATDVAARGLDIKGVDTVVHYQLPASADTYIHRSGRTARAEAAGISIALVTPKEASRFMALCRALGRPPPPSFPIDAGLMKGAHQRVRLAERIDAIERSERKEHAEDTWMVNNAEALDIVVDDEDRPKKKSRMQADEDAPITSSRAKKREAAELAGLKAELASMLASPLQHSVSERYFAGGISRPALRAVAGKDGGKDDGKDGATGEEVGEEVKAMSGDAAAHTVALAQRLAQSRTAARTAASQGKDKSPHGGAKKSGPARTAAALMAALKSPTGKLKKRQPPELARLLMSRNAMKRQKKGGLVVVGPAFGRDTQAPNALEAMRTKMAAKGK